MEGQLKKEGEIFAKLARQCSRSEECSPDIKKKILDLGGDFEMQDRIIKRLQDEKFLDDERYVRAYTRDKFRLNKWGRVKMRYYLKMKGLQDSIIETGFEEIDEEQYVKLLIKTIKEKAKTVKKANKFEKMGQVIRYAQGRGFEPELIHRHINSVVQ
jgi:regulatory protein